MVQHQLLKLIDNAKKILRASGLIVVIEPGTNWDQCFISCQHHIFSEQQKQYLMIPHGLYDQKNWKTSNINNKKPSGPHWLCFIADEGHQFISTQCRYQNAIFAGHLCIHNKEFIIALLLSITYFNVSSYCNVCTYTVNVLIIGQEQDKNKKFIHLMMI